jgi:hypothetical protein
MQMSKPHALTESERALVTMALREKAEADDKRAKLYAPLGPEGLWATFHRQAKEALRLADLIEGADLIDVWPYEPDVDAFGQTPSALGLDG